MSRRHRGRPHQHTSAAPDVQRRGPAPEATATTAQEPNIPRATAAGPPRATSATEERPARPTESMASPPAPAASLTGFDGRQNAPPREPSPAAEPRVAPSSSPTPPPQAHNGERGGQCTAPQLRRFIKSRPYVPMHELRRRFSINGDDDDVTPVRMDPGWIYVGLPNHEGHLLGDLLRTGEIGYELSLDPRTPIVIGVYPMRPIPRT